jgi:hypothetical protein
MITSFKEYPLGLVADDQFSCFLFFKEGVPMIRLIPDPNVFCPKQIYFFSQFALCVLEQIPFRMQMFEGDATCPIPLADVRQIVERGMERLRSEGEFTLTFIEHDMMIPF